jgi:hypothetical protein
VHYGLFWQSRDGVAAEGSGDQDFMRLPASGRLQIHFEHPIGFTPDAIDFVVEGGGPADHFRFTGEFAIQQVPEATIFALLGSATVVGLSLLRRWRPGTSEPTDPRPAKTPTIDRRGICPMETVSTHWP